MLIWGSLYFFVFEMKKLAEILKSDSFEESLAQRRRTRRAKIIVYSLFLIVIVASANILYITKMINKNAYTENIYLFDVMLIIRCVTKLSIDIYMFHQFIVLFRFFCALKLKALKKLYGKKVELSPQNLMIIYFTIFIWILNCFYSFSVSVVWSYYQSSLV